MFDVFAALAATMNMIRAMSENDTARMAAMSADIRRTYADSGGQNVIDLLAAAHKVIAAMTALIPPPNVVPAPTTRKKGSRRAQ